MPRTQVRGKQVLDRSIQRDDLDNETPGQAVIVKAKAGDGISLSQTGPDEGTGDVTIAISPDVRDKTYVHEQLAPDTTWTIVHRLNKYPSVTVFDSTDSGEVVFGDVAYIDENTVTVSFSAAFAGKAFLN